MIFTNHSGLPAAWTLGFRADGRELLVVIVKASFTLPLRGEPAGLAAEQVPLVEADTFSGEPGLSAPRVETDFAHQKPGCDVLLLGSAYAPAGRRVERCRVGLRVGSMHKHFVAVGRRVWHKRLGVVLATRAEPFESLPLGYDTAWGGTDRTREADGRTEVCRRNPVGRGFWKHTKDIDGQPLPHTEQAGQPIESHDGDYLPQAYSAVGRAWLPRAGWAGTYDAAWLAERSPLWPHDFDARYFQSAPADQVIPYPVGGEPVVLQNLSPRQATIAFALPAMRMPVTFVPHRGRDLTLEAQVDTVVLEPDADRFTMTWRCTLPLGRSVFDVKEAIAGHLPPAWHRARRFPGKTYHASLADAVRARRSRGRGA